MYQMWRMELRMLMDILILSFHYEGKSRVSFETILAQLRLSS